MEFTRALVRAMRTLFIASLFISGVQPALAELAVSIEAGPIPAEPGEALDVEITVSNTDASARSGVRLTLPFPAESLADLSESHISDGGDCVGGGNAYRCDTVDDSVVWDLGTIAGGSGLTVRLTPQVDPTVTAGSVVNLAPHVEDASGATDSAQVAIDISADRLLELWVADDSDPVQPGEELTYSLTYGYSGSSSIASGSEVELSLPPGVTIISATGNATHDAGSVRWPLGTLQPGAIGRQQVVVAVAADLTPGSLLLSRAQLHDDSGLITRADAVTRLDDERPLELAIEAGPDPIQPGEVLDIELTVTNPGAFDRSGVTLRLPYPGGELDDLSQSAVSDGGQCEGVGVNPNICDSAGDYLLWDLGTLPAGTGTTVKLRPTVAADLEPGRSLALVPWVTDDQDLRIRANRAVPVSTARRLQLRLADEPDPVMPGEVLTYVLTYGYSGTSSVASGSELYLPLPDGVTFISATGNSTVALDSVRWPLGTLQSGAVGRQEVVVAVPADLTPGSLLLSQAQLSDDGGHTTRADAVTRVEGERPLELAIEVGPDPIQPGEVLDIELTVTNTSAFDRSGVRLRLPYPGSDLNDLSESAISDAGDCIGGGSNSYACDSLDDHILWDIDTLAAGTGITVKLRPTAKADLSPGRSLALVPWVTDDQGLRTRANRAIPVRAERLLQLRLGEERDPVVPGEMLSYTLTYGYSGTSSAAPGSELELSLPEDVTLVSASGDATGGADSVHWLLGDLQPGEVGRHQAVVSVPANRPPGSLLFARAQLRDDGGGIVRADSLARAESERPLELAIDANPSPILPGEALDIELTVTNSSTFERSGVRLRLPYPGGELDDLSESAISHAGDCIGGGSNSYACDSVDDHILWELGTLPAGSSETVSLQPTVSAATTKGAAIAFSGWVEDATARSRSRYDVPIGTLFGSASVSPTAGLVTTEAGGSDSFTVVLDSQPTADVSIALASSDPSEGVVAPGSLLFTPDNWSTPQPATVTGVDDTVTDGNVAYIVTVGPATSSDPGYDGIDPANVLVTNLDDESTTDSDGDGMSDVWEATYGLDPFDPGDAASDLDGDGYSNLSEFLGGSSPDDPTDTPQDVSCSGTETTISSRSYSSGEWVLCQASVDLHAGGAVTVNAGASVVYVAPSVRLASGFSVREGGNFSAGNSLP